jgi:phage protein D
VPKASIVLIDGDASQQTFTTSEEDTLMPGVEIEILGGYSKEEKTLFKGIVTRHRVEVGPGNRSRLSVEIRDPVFRMTLGRRSRNFVDVTDSDVIEQMIGFNQGLTADVEATSLQHPQIVQHQVSDWDFIVMRAELAGLAVVCIDGTVRIAKPAISGAAEAAAIFGQGLLSADLELDAETQLTKVETGAWDMANQALVTAESEDVPTPGPGDVAATSPPRAASVRRFAIPARATRPCSTSGPPPPWAARAARRCAAACASRARKSSCRVCCSNWAVLAAASMA